VRTPDRTPKERPPGGELSCRLLSEHQARIDRALDTDEAGLDRPPRLDDLARWAWARAPLYLTTGRRGLAGLPLASADRDGCDICERPPGHGHRGETWHRAARVLPAAAPPGPQALR